MNAASPEPGVAPPWVRLIGTLRGHRDAVGDVAWSPDGSLLATASKDATAQIWDGASHARRHTVSAHKGGLRAVAFDRHGRILATGSDDGLINLWQVGSWECLKTLDLSADLSVCNSLAFSPRQDVLAYGGDRSAVLVDISTGKIRYQFRRVKGDSRIRQVVFDPEGVTVATAGGDSGTASRLVSLWDASDGHPQATLDGHTDTVTTVAFSPDGRLLASGGWDKTIKIWDSRSGNLVRTLEGHVAVVRSVSFLADGRLLASKSSDGSVRLWDCGTWTPAGVIPEPGQGLWTPRLAFHPSQPVLATLALQRLKDEGVIELDEERKAAMVSNLLVVLCSEQATQQVVNTGSLYQ